MHAFNVIKKSSLNFCCDKGDSVFIGSIIGSKIQEHIIRAPITNKNIIICLFIVIKILMHVGLKAWYINAEGGLGVAGSTMVSLA